MLSNLGIIPIFIAVGLLICALTIDARNFIIPNWISIGLLATLPFAWLTNYPVHPLDQLVCFVVITLISGLMWKFRIWFGGDFKLISSLAPWIGLSEMPEFLLITTFTGGVLAMLILVFRKRIQASGLRTKEWRDKFSKNMPYGIAISIAGIFILLAKLSSNV